MSKFYTFRQNNNGGVFQFDIKRGISVSVVVEADNEDEAIERAEGVGLYFDGDGDCRCCGNRWDTYIEGHDVPWVDGPQAFVHYKDGRIVPMEGVLP